eukprot:6174819-Pleurochrysis_carterae.AAC.2
MGPADASTADMTVDPAPETTSTEDNQRQRREPLRRGLGTYPLRSRSPPAAVLLTQNEPAYRSSGRGTGCAFAMAPTADAKTRKQALSDDFAS